MIYEAADASSPVSQGDIFTGIPCVELPPDCLKVFLEDEKLYRLNWEEFALEGTIRNALVGVRPVQAIVGSQDCDAVRAPDVTLFEIRPFSEVEGKSKQTTAPAPWMRILTQHSKVNQKWFYLPPDELCDFTSKMAVDFDVSLRVPRGALTRLLGFRKARLNQIASAHFRERISEYFRRYAYDEWYALNREEFEEYSKTRPDSTPYPWQTDD